MWQFKFQFIIPCFVYKGYIAKEFLVHPHTKDTDKVSSFRNFMYDDLIIFWVKDLLDNACPCMIGPVEENQNRVYSPVTQKRSCKTDSNSYTISFSLSLGQGHAGTKQ